MNRATSPRTGAAIAGEVARIIREHPDRLGMADWARHDGRQAHAHPAGWDDDWVIPMFRSPIEEWPVGAVADVAGMICSVALRSEVISDQSLFEQGIPSVAAAVLEIEPMNWRGHLMMSPAASQRHEAQHLFWSGRRRDEVLRGLDRIADGIVPQPGDEPIWAQA